MMVFLSSFLSKSGGGVLKKKAEFFLRQKEKKEKTSKSRFITSTKKGSGISLSSFPEAAGRRRV